MLLTKKGYKKFCLFQMFFVNLSSYWEKMLIICCNSSDLLTFLWTTFSLSLLKDYLMIGVPLQTFRRFKSVFSLLQVRDAARSFLRTGFYKTWTDQNPPKIHQVDSSKNLTRNDQFVVPIHSSAWFFKDSFIH